MKEKVSPDRRQYRYCLRCGRKLISDEAKERGMGKICWEKAQVEKGKRHILF